MYPLLKFSVANINPGKGNLFFSDCIFDNDGIYICAWLLENTHCDLCVWPIKTNLSGVSL